METELEDIIERNSVSELQTEALNTSKHEDHTNMDNLKGSIICDDPYRTEEKAVRKMSDNILSPTFARKTPDLTTSKKQKSNNRMSVQTPDLKSKLSLSSIKSNKEPDDTPILEIVQDDAIPMDDLDTLAKLYRKFDQ